MILEFQFLLHQKFLPWLFALWIFVFLPSCKDIFERNLEKSSITLQTPPDNYQSTEFTITFWWDEVKGADQYRFQIATPDFTGITQLVADTPVVGNKYTFTLNPGSYCWRVRAENNSSHTEYATRCFSVDSTPDLASQTMVLFSPASDFATPNSSITFKWYPLLNADDYRFELWTPGFNGSLVLPVSVLTDTFYNASSLSEAKYEWGVRGQNTFSNTAMATRKFIVDATAPSIPVPQVPANNDTLDGSDMDFSWTQAIDSGSTIFDSLSIFSDTVNWYPVKEYLVSGTSQSVDTLPPGTYFWDIMAVDAAGNKSNYTSIRKFVVQ